MKLLKKFIKKPLFIIIIVIFILILAVKFEPLSLCKRIKDNFKINLLHKELQKSTLEHINYLSSIGLAERAQGIKISKFKSNLSDSKFIDLAPFEKRTPIPAEVLKFDVNLKNTIITTDPNISGNDPKDLKKILDIRLYPTLRNLIRDYGVEIFLGTPQEMEAYYNSKGGKILFKFEIPSSAVYYLAQINEKLFVVMADLVSKENIVAQLLTLKLAGIKVDDIEIIGNPEHFKEIVDNDIEKLIVEIPQIQKGINVLIVAGCGLECMVSNIINCELKDQTEYSIDFDGNIVSLIYTPLKKQVNGINGFISLNLNYGEIVEEVIKQLLEKCNCKYVFTGGAGGYIPKNESEAKPEIGSRISIIKSMNPQGEIVQIKENILSKQISRMHLQIPSIFLETYKWLENAKNQGSSVDVETFYIIRAIQNYNMKNPKSTVKGDFGFFVSDYVGEQPLREYSKVYTKYPDILSEFIRYVISN